MRLLQETMGKDEVTEDWEETGDKKFAAMGNARTIQTVSGGNDSCSIKGHLPLGRRL